MAADEIVARGHFWLNDPEQAVAGELKYSPADGTSLYLFGGLAVPRTGERGHPVRFPVVHGYTEELQWVRLINAMVLQQQFGLRPLASELYSDVIISSSVNYDTSGLPITAITASVDNLHSWLGVSGFVIEHLPGHEPLKVTYTLPDAIPFKVEDYAVSFRFGRTGPTMTRAQREVKIVQITHLRLDFDKPIALDEATQKLFLIINLLSLGVGFPLSWSDVEVKFAVPLAETTDTWSRLLGRPEQVRRKEDVQPFNMLFTFSDVKERFSNMLSSWHSLSEKTNALYTLYSATTRATNIHSELRLFNFFQGLESFHRNTTPPDVTSKQKLRALKKKILEACSEDERVWLAEKLAYLGDPTARDRVRELIVAYKGEWIFQPDWEVAIKRIADMRNYFTHYSRELPSEFLDPANIYNDGSRLQVFCEQIILVAIGFPPSDATKLLQGKRRLERLLVS